MVNNPDCAVAPARTVLQLQVGIEPGLGERQGSGTLLKDVVLLSGDNNLLVDNPAIGAPKGANTGAPGAANGPGVVVSGGGELGVVLRKMREVNLNGATDDYDVQDHGGVIKVGGVDREGKWKGLEVNTAGNGEDATRLSLSGMGLKTLNLNALSMRRLKHSLGHIREVSLAANALVNIELSTIAQACPNLESLILNGNAMKNIDLSALEFTPRLERLWLHNNVLSKIDLKPLEKTLALRSLYLDGNQLHEDTLDVAPLKKCKVLRALRLGRNRLGGMLDITPLLGCVALSTLDVGASVRLVAQVDMEGLSAQSAAAALPPALRRRAATVVWRRKNLGTRTKSCESVDSPSQSGTSVDLDDDSESSETSDSSDSDLDEVVGQYEVRAKAPNHGLSSSEKLPTSPISGTDSPSNAAAADKKTIPPEATNDYIKSRQRHRHRHREYTAVLIGFRRNARFATEALLAEHANLKTIALTPDSSQSLSALSTALARADVILVQPFADKLTSDIRRARPTVPIIVVGAQAASESAARCLRNGARCFLTSPLGQRDAYTIRALAQQSARERSVRMKRSRSGKSCDSFSDGSETDGADTNDSAGETKSVEEESCDGYRDSWGSPVTPHSSSEPGTPGVSPNWAYHRQQSARSSLLSGLERVSSARSGSASVDFTQIFDRLRSRCAGVCHDRTGIEESALNMLFSRMGHQAAVEKDFHSVATLCGLPVCSVSVLFRSTLRCRRLWNGVDEDSIESATAPKEVDHETFHRFWLSFLRGRTAETRLFNILALACASKAEMPALMAVEREFAKRANGKDGNNGRWSKRKGADSRKRGIGRGVERLKAGSGPCLMRYKVGRDMIVQLAEALVKGKNQSIAGAVLCFTLSGGRWSSVSSRKLTNSKLCASLLAAESGVFQGVCAKLRADRLSSIRQSFLMACGVTGSTVVCRSEAMYFFAKRGLYTPRALESIFARGSDTQHGGLAINDWAPLWISANEPGTSQAAEYLWDIMDMDLDGYVDARDCAVFYAEKRGMMKRKNLVAAEFEHIWKAMVDNVGLEKTRGKVFAQHHEKSSQPSRSDVDKGDPVLKTEFVSRISKHQFCEVSEKERVKVLQSFLFIEDDMILLDLSKTKDEDFLSAINEAENAGAAPLAT